MERNEIVARYIWTMGQTIQLQNDYRNKQFRNHPNIATVINYYLFQHRVPTNAYNSDIKKIREDIKSVVSWKAQATRDIKRALERS